MTELFERPDNEDMRVRIMVDCKTDEVDEKPVFNGLECPDCGHPLRDRHPRWTWGGNPPSKTVICNACGWEGRRTCDKVRIPLSEVTDLGMLRGSVGELWDIVSYALGSTDIAAAMRTVEQRRLALGWKVDDDGLHLIEWR